MRGRERKRERKEEEKEERGRGNEFSKTLNPSRWGRNGALGPDHTGLWMSHWCLACVCVFQQIPSKWKTSSAQFPNSASAKILRHNDLWATVFSHQESTFSREFNSNLCIFMHESTVLSILWRKWNINKNSRRKWNDIKFPTESWQLIIYIKNEWWYQCWHAEIL